MKIFKVRSFQLLSRTDQKMQQAIELPRLSWNIFEHFFFTENAFKSKSIVVSRKPFTTSTRLHQNSHYELDRLQNSKWASCKHSWLRNNYECAHDICNIAASEAQPSELRMYIYRSLINVILVRVKMRLGTEH